MARPTRHQVCPECPSAPPLYHVTNRGVDHNLVFRNLVDFVVFLSTLALVCAEDGLKVHAFCLMSNHFHLLLEDPRGMLSRAMARLTSSYARYFNDARGRRGSGHVFGDRFHCKLVDTAHYYDRLCSYILLNPLRCEPPLCADPFAYLGSSAALHARGGSAADYFRELVERAGGVEAILARMPAPSHPSVTENRRRRLEALCSAAWIDPLVARCDRTAEAFRQVLEERLGMGRPAPEDFEAPSPEPMAVTLSTEESPGRGAKRRGRTTLPLEIATAPRVTERFEGRPLEEALERVREGLAAWMPAGIAAAGDLASWLCWRFSCASMEAIAGALAIGEQVVERAVQEVRGLRQSSQAWERQLRGLEWRIRWLLRSGPCRA